MPEVVHWNPPRGAFRRIPILRNTSLVPRKNNFGDLLGPWIVDRLVTRLGLGTAIAKTPRLLAVGSIMRLAQRDDVVWGAGINGKSLEGTVFPRLDVRAVRGPLTAAHLREAGNTVPDVYGDPALLIPSLWADDELGIRRGTGGTLLMPNLFDVNDWPPSAVDPRGPVVDRVRALASATRVVASSLHAVIIAEAYGVPAVLVGGGESPFKYEDYYEGTGRRLPPIAPDWRAGMEWDAADPITAWDGRRLEAAFPADLWSRGAAA
ncbi:MAG: putative polysaccharide biosynthesis protein [Microbacterium sp.]|nr:putative polysaccharide biosynthesis protein [Microbacterium sp.]